MGFDSFDGWLDGEHISVGFVVRSNIFAIHDDISLRLHHWIELVLVLGRPEAAGYVSVLGRLQMKVKPQSAFHCLSPNLLLLYGFFACHCCFPVEDMKTTVVCSLSQPDLHCCM